MISRTRRAPRLHTADIAVVDPARTPMVPPQPAKRRMPAIPPHSRYLLCWLALPILAPLLVSCVVLTAEPRALLLQEDGAIRVQSIPCAAPQAAPTPPPVDPATALDPNAIRILTWNIHKEGDTGWQRDLASYAEASDIVMLQEVVLRDDLRSTVESAGLRWVMASSFLRNDEDVGVLTAARVTPRNSCTQRTLEPLLRVPKSTVITWFRLAEGGPILAVANLHGINFTLTLGAYHEQLAAVGDALAAHRGPIVLGGDLNTWNEARVAAVHALATRLGLTEVRLADDRRSVFLGQHVDHLFVRNLDVIAAQAFTVTSSDHNPVAATVRFVPQNGSSPSK